MPRGRIRRRSTGRTGTTGRNNSSTSRRPNSRSRAPRSTSRNLRRSNRIAEQLSQQGPVSDASMADVARRTHATASLGPRLVQAPGTSRQRFRRDGPNGTAEDSSNAGRRGLINQGALDTNQSPIDDLQCTMDVIQQPPPIARTGTTLSPGLTVRLRSLSPEVEDSDLSHLLAVATLTYGNGAASPDQLQNSLAGRRFDSIHPPEDVAGNGDVGYMHFPDLVIHNEGIFRIRITLIRVRNGDSGNVSPTGIANAGSHVEAVDSNPITIAANGPDAEQYSGQNNRVRRR